MARRLFSGRQFSENGWPYVDQGSCTWIKVPGTNGTVSLQIQNGAPLAVMQGFAADFHAYIEPLRDADSACWTEGNSVASSNHPGGTAMDLDWDSHAFQQRGTFNPAQQATINELLAWYEDMIFWGGRWQSPIDEMHWQMGYDTYDQGADRPEPKVADFIARKIRSDGFSTFRRGSAVPPPVLSREDQYALACIREGQRLGITPRGIQIALSVELAETNETMYANSNDPPSLNLPHDKVGSDHMSSGLFQQQPNWGPLADRMDATRSATLFFTCDNGPGTRGLTKIKERVNGHDGDPYDYNSPAQSMGFYAQKVQGSAFPDRYDERMDEAIAQYNRLVGVVAPPQQPGDDMAAVPQDQWDRVYRALTQPLVSRSPLRHLGEGPIDTVSGFTLNIDGSEHVEICRLLASLGHPPTLALLQEVAGADPTRYPDRQQDRLIAQAILADLASQPGAAVAVDAAPASSGALAAAYAENARLRDENARLQAAPAVSTALAPIEATVVQADGTGQAIGDLYNVLDRLRLADALPVEGRAPLAALIAVLQTKNGSQL